MGRAIDSPVSPFINFIAPSNAVVWAMVDFVSLHTHLFVVLQCFVCSYSFLNILYVVFRTVCAAS